MKTKLQQIDTVKKTNVSSTENFPNNVLVFTNPIKEKGLYFKILYTDEGKISNGKYVPPNSPTNATKRGFMVHICINQKLKIPIKLMNRNTII